VSGLSHQPDNLVDPYNEIKLVDFPDRFVPFVRNVSRFGANFAKEWSWWFGGL
jgi:hypothetical protein